MKKQIYLTTGISLLYLIYLISSIFYLKTLYEGVLSWQHSVNIGMDDIDFSPILAQATGIFISALIVFFLISFVAILFYIYIFSKTQKIKNILKIGFSICLLLLIISFISRPIINYICETIFYADYDKYLGIIVTFSVLLILTVAIGTYLIIKYAKHLSHSSSPS